MDWTRHRPTCALNIASAHVGDMLVGDVIACRARPGAVSTLREPGTFVVVKKWRASVVLARVCEMPRKTVVRPVLHVMRPENPIFRSYGMRPGEIAVTAHGSALRVRAVDPRVLLDALPLVVVPSHVSLSTLDLVPVRHPC